MAVTKVINSESKQYKPVLTDMLVLDAVPTVNSLNGVTSDAVARAIAGASGEVPQVTENDNGKVLGAIYDEGGAAVEWVEPPVALPEYDTDDDGKVLGVVVSGVEPTASVEWVEPSSYTAGAGLSLSSNTFNVNAGDGLTIGNESITRTTTAVVPTDASGIGNYIAALNSSLVSSISNDGLSCEFLIDYGVLSGVTSADYYIAICPIGSYGNAMTQKLVFGQPISAVKNPDNNWVIPTGTVFTILSSEINTSLSNITLADVQNNPTGYCIVPIYYNSWYGQYVTINFKVTDAGEGTAETANLSYTETMSNCVKVSNPVPSSTSLDENKVLTVNSSGNAVWATPATPSVDEVPTVGSTDDGKVLTASYSGGVGSYSWQTAQGGGSSLPSITGNEYKVLSVNSNASATEWTLPLRKAGFTVNFDSTKKIYTVSVPNSGYQLYGVEGEFLSTISIMSYSSTTINNLWLLINDSQYNDADTQSSVDSFYWTKAIQVISGTATMNEYKSWPLFMTELSLRKKSSGQVKVHLALSSSPSIADAINNVSISGVTGRLLETI